MTDYTELIRSLRNCSNNRCTPCDCGWFDKYQVDESCKEIIMWKAADAIERITAMYEKAEMDATSLTGRLAQAEADVERLEPKRGEWIIHGEPPMLVIECSVCGQKYFNHVMQEKAKYCSMCGAKMGGTE